jgi:hypothetical protein
MDETLASGWGEEGFEAFYTAEHSQDDQQWRIELARVE